MLIITTRYPAQTKWWGERLGRCLGKGDIVCLIGGLGVGKTLFGQGVAKGLGVRSEYVTSPTFLMLREYYDSRLPLFHFDLYRLESITELYDLGYEEYFFGDGVTIIEWAEKIEELIPIEYLRVEIRWLAQNAREINFIPFGEHYQQIVNSLKGQLKK
ncbi:MAG: tRNA (adenosine(37)-N6)-threonylcarbamoyltransferase complex ATPase subunit type 1 TsaE [bacterium]